MTAASLTATQPVVGVLVVFAGLCGLLWVATCVDLDDSAMFVGADERSQRPWQSGLAISGECLSTITLMSLVSAVALTGYDGLMLTLGSVTGLVLVALLTARPLRAAGGHTLGDALARRLPGRSVRIAFGLVTLALCMPYLVLQLTSVGTLIALVLGSAGSGAKAACITVVGTLMVSLAISGGVRGTGRVQAVKVVLLLAVMAVLAAVVLHRFGWSSGRLWEAALRGSDLGEGFMAPGVQHGMDVTGVLNRLGQTITLALAFIGLPQVVMRVLAAPGGARLVRSMHWAVTQHSAVISVVVVVGLGATAVVGGSLRQAEAEGGSALLSLAAALDGQGRLLSVVCCAVLLTALATVVDVTLAAAVSVVRDLVGSGKGSDRGVSPGDARHARWAAAGVGAVAILLAVGSRNWNLWVLATFVMALSASAVAPVMLYGLLWPRFNRTGALWCLYGAGALVAVVVLGSPLLSGGPSAVFPDRDFQWFALLSPGLVTIPAGFALGWLGSVLSPHGSAAAPAPVTSERALSGH